MAVTEAERTLALSAGRLAARTGRPMTACPYDKRTQRTLALWFVRGYLSVKPSRVSYKD